MNSNLLMMLDQVSFAPSEKKGEILSILVSENSFKSRNGTGTVTRELILKIISKVFGKNLICRWLNEYYSKNPKQAEEDFSNLLAILINKEPLPLIQDFLYALHKTNWKYSVEDMKRHYENVLLNIYYNTDGTTTHTPPDTTTI